MTTQDQTTIYHEFSGLMEDGNKSRDDMIDRAAFIYVTGHFPSHLRQHYTAALRTITQYFRRPVALDGRTGNIRLDDRAVADMQLDQHPMVNEVRAKLAQGYLIQPSRGFGARRPYWRVFMFKLAGDRISEKITVYGNGSVKSGWE